MKPDEIERLSFKIIDQEAGAHHFPPDQWQILRRVIHTTADFEYMDTIRFQADAIARGLAALENAQPIITDTNMARTGIRLEAIENRNSAVHCFIGNESVVKIAAQSGITRSRAAVDYAVDRWPESVFVIGNAPTALLRLIDHIVAGRATPSLVVGLPVGFVNAAESKAALMKMDVPYISNVGRKGGSTVVASIINALARLTV
jgi:precorrin-8X/cobalt-precorrin-8 methylmutase